MNSKQADDLLWAVYSKKPTGTDTEFHKPNSCLPILSDTKVYLYPAHKHKTGLYCMLESQQRTLTSTKNDLFLPSNLPGY